MTLQTGTQALSQKRQTEGYVKKLFSFFQFAVVVDNDYPVLYPLGKWLITRGNPGTPCAQSKHNPRRQSMGHISLWLTPRLQAP